MIILLTPAQVGFGDVPAFPVEGVVAIVAVVALFIALLWHARRKAKRAQRPQTHSNAYRGATFDPKEIAKAHPPDMTAGR